MNNVLNPSLSLVQWSTWCPMFRGASMFAFLVGGFLSKNSGRSKSQGCKYAIYV